MSKRPTLNSAARLDAAPDSGPGFEQSLEQLELIIERIETGQVGLEAAIAEYEKGVGLLRRCRDILKRAEQRVEELNREAAGGEQLPSGATPDSSSRHEGPEHED